MVAVVRGDVYGAPVRPAGNDADPDMAGRTKEAGEAAETIGTGKNWQRPRTNLLV